jgi:hypothetical protein
VIHGATPRLRARVCLTLGSIALAVGLTAAAGSIADETTARRLFHIERSKNANVVVYDARLTADGRLDAGDPVVAYWMELARDGRRKKLSGIERRFAYGFKARFVDDDTVVLKMAAKIGRQITVDVAAGQPRAIIEIAGHRSVLDRVYVQSTGKGPWPSVEFLDVFGVDLETGVDRRERIYP